MFGSRPCTTRGMGSRSHGRSHWFDPSSQPARIAWKKGISALLSPSAPACSLHARDSAHFRRVRRCRLGRTLRVDNPPLNTLHAVFLAGSKSTAPGIGSTWKTEHVLKVSPIQMTPETMRINGADTRPLGMVVIERCSSCGGSSALGDLAILRRA